MIENTKLDPLWKCEALGNLMLLLGKCREIIYQCEICPTNRTSFTTGLPLDPLVSLLKSIDESSEG
jgi:hypothetical protein